MIWINYNNSLTWNKVILGIPLLTIIPEGEQASDQIYPDIFMVSTSFLPVSMVFIGDGLLLTPGIPITMGLFSSAVNPGPGAQFYPHPPDLPRYSPELESNTAARQSAAERGVWGGWRSSKTNSGTGRSGRSVWRDIYICVCVYVICIYIYDTMCIYIYA